MFETNLCLYVFGNNQYKLAEDLIFTTEEYSITVLSGFAYDGATIPRSLWEEIGCPADYLYESCIHDALYATALFDRKTCDKIFHKCLLARGVDIITAKAMYLAVRAMGGNHYGTDSKSNARNFVKIDIIYK